MPVQVSEGSLFKLGFVIWLVCFTLGGLFAFPFGFVAMGIIGIAIAGLGTFLYVRIMDLAYGERGSNKGARKDFVEDDEGETLTLYGPRDE